MSKEEDLRELVLNLTNLSNTTKQQQISLLPKAFNVPVYSLLKGLNVSEEFTNEEGLIQEFEISPEFDLINTAAISY